MWSRKRRKQKKRHCIKGSRKKYHLIRCSSRRSWLKAPLLSLIYAKLILTQAYVLCTKELPLLESAWTNMYFDNNAVKLLIHRFTIVCNPNPAQNLCNIRILKTPATHKLIIVLRFLFSLAMAVLTILKST